MTILYNVTLINGWLIVVLVLGTLGFTTLGTLLAAMTVQTRAREALLPIVMMPVVLPLLLAAVRASTGILNATPQSDWIQWVQIRRRPRRDLSDDVLSAVRVCGRGMMTVSYAAIHCAYSIKRTMEFAARIARYFCRFLEVLRRYAKIFVHLVRIGVTR